MEKINFKLVDKLLIELPVDVNKIIYEYYNNFCNFCSNEMCECFSCKNFFCMISRCGNSLCICEKMSKYGFYPYGSSKFICSNRNKRNKQLEHYDDCFYKTFYCYNCNLYCYKCYYNKIVS